MKKESKVIKKPNQIKSDNKTKLNFAKLEVEIVSEFAKSQDLFVVFINGDDKTKRTRIELDIREIPTSWRVYHLAVIRKLTLIELSRNNFNKLLSFSSMTWARFSINMSTLKRKF